MTEAANNDETCLIRKNEITYLFDYPDVYVSTHAKLLSLSVETYGRWGTDSLRLLHQMANYKASDAPSCLQKSIAQVFSKRAWGILSISLQKAIADSILNEFGADLTEAAGHEFFDDRDPPIDFLADMDR